MPTLAKPVPVLEKPKRPTKSDEQQRIDETSAFVTIDAAIQILAEESCFGHLTWWSYVYPRGSGDLFAQLTVAAQQAPIKGNYRLRATMDDQINVFWKLHSQFRGATCQQVRNYYSEILQTVAELHNDFDIKNITGGNGLLQKMAEFSGVLGETETNIEKYNPIYNKEFERTDLTAVVRLFLDKYGAISRDSRIANRVNVDLNVKFHFSKVGLLELCVRIMASLIAREKRNGKLDALIKWDHERVNEGLISIFFLAMPCSLDAQDDTRLREDFFGNPHVQQIQKATGSEEFKRLTNVFTYSAVGETLEQLMLKQEEVMQGDDKTRDTYSTFLVDGLSGTAFPPWTYKGGWPREAKMEAANLARAMAIINSVPLKKTAKRPRDELSLGVEPADERQYYKKLKAVANDPGPTTAPTVEQNLPPAEKVLTEKEQHYKKLKAVANDPGDSPELEVFRTSPMEVDTDSSNLFIFLGALAAFGVGAYVIRRR